MHRSLLPSLTNASQNAILSVVVLSAVEQCDLPDLNVCIVSITVKL